MSATTTGGVVGTPRDRVDGRLKVMGAATYPIDVTFPGVAYAVLVGSTVTSGRIRHIAVEAAQRAPGVLAVITHGNAPPLARGPATEIGPQPLPPFQSDDVLHYGQHVAMVVAETREEANAAAALIEVTYERDTPVLSFDDPRASRVSHPWTPDCERGDVHSALAAADVQVSQTYRTTDNTNNPIGLFATVAAWDGDALTVHDTTQYPHAVRDTLAAAFGIDPAGVRVLAPFVGGAFGAGLRAWPHVTLAALAARVTRRPVKLVLTRAQMFTSVGHRPNTIQQLSIGASRGGQLTAIEHVSTSSIGMADELINLIMRNPPRIRVPECFDSRDPDSPEYPYPWLDACTRRSRRLVRHGVGHRRAFVRPGHRSHRVACEESRARASEFWPALVEQRAPRLLSTGRRALRLVGAYSTAAVDAQRATACRIRRGTRRPGRLSTAVQSHCIRTARWNGLRTQRRDRYRSGPVHRDDDARGGLSWRADRARAVRSR
jgi:hypothetical protein